MNKISGYTQTYNCIDKEYPFEECIKSLLGFCDEVIVLDCHSNDGTYEKLLSLSENNSKLKVHLSKSNTKSIQTLEQSPKSEARSYCTGEWCWQADVDEIVHEEDYLKIRNLILDLGKMKDFKKVDVFCLPIVEFWGHKGKVRVDINSWKWRLSRNKDYIVHGVRKEFREYDDNGKLISTSGSDACEYIHKETYEGIPFVLLYNPIFENLRANAVHDQQLASTKWQDFVNYLIDSLPTVYHYSWFDIAKKIKDHKEMWSKIWASRLNVEKLENYMFDKDWQDVTDEDISSLAERLESDLGGWVFHRKINWKQKTSSITINKSHPKVMNSFIKRKLDSL